MATRTSEPTAAAASVAAPALQDDTQLYIVTVFVPVAHAPAVRQALASSGAGAVGCYDSGSWSTRGTGRFRPLAGARPAIGQIGVLEEVEEERVETDVRGTTRLRRVLAAVRAAHPYEEPSIYVTRVHDYKDFM
jgi:hypothetical protein